MTVIQTLAASAALLSFGAALPAPAAGAPGGGRAPAPVVAAARYFRTGHALSLATGEFLYTLDATGDEGQARQVALQLLPDAQRELAGEPEQVQVTAAMELLRDNGSD